MTVLDTRRAGVSQAPNEPAPKGRGGLPSYTNNQQLNTGFVPRINTSAFAAPGRGLSAVGNAIGNLAGALDAHNKKNQDYEASLGFAKLQGELNRQEFAHRTTHEAPDGTGYATDWSIKANHVFGAFEASLTEEQLQKYAPALQRMKDGYSNKAATHQYGKTQKYQSEQLNNSYTIHQNLLLKDPSDEQYENSRLALENQIDARDIPEPQKARDKATLRIQLGLTRALAYTKTGQFDKAEAILDAQEAEVLEKANNASRSIINYSRPGQFKITGKNVNMKNVRPDVIKSLTNLQNAFGKQLSINDGFRSKPGNGAKKSQHLHGNAIDINVAHLSKAERVRLIELAYQSGFTGIGVGQNIIHVDKGRARSWGYKGPSGGAPVPQWAAGIVSKYQNALRSGRKIPQLKDESAQASFKGAPDYRGQKGPAAVRYNNPGAQWPGPSAKKFGMTHSVTLKDGQNNKIAVFPTMIHGGAAQFDLLNRRYVGKPLAVALKEWSGGNNSQGYINGVVQKTGLNPNTVLTKEMMQDPRIAIPLTKAMSQHEASNKKVMSDQHWAQAHKFFMSGGKGEVASFVQRETPQAPKQYLKTIEKIEGYIQQAKIKHLEEQFITGVVSGKIRVTGNDTEAMKLMNKVFNEKFGPETDFLRDKEANEFVLSLSKNKTVLPKRWFQKMEGYLSSAEPKDRELAFQLMDKVEANNPENFNAGIGVQNLHKKLDQFRMMSEYHGPEGAVKQMMFAEERLSKMNVEELKAEKNQFLKDLNSEETLLEAFDDNISFWPGGIFGAGPDQDPTLGVSKAQKAQMKAEFRHLAVSEFEKTGNQELAKASALHMIKKRYGVTEFSYITAGQRSVMKYPPENFVASKDLPFVKEQFQKDSQEVVAKWSKILGKQGIKVIGEPILISDDHTRKGYEEWIAGKKSQENAGLLMSGLSMIEETRDLPEWRFALKVEINGETGYRLVDDYFSIEGLAQLSRVRLEHDLLTNKAIGELVKEGKYRPNDPANFIRKIFNYEPRELVNKREEMLNRK